MAGGVAYVQLSGASTRATLGLYAGMEPHELQVLVRAALNHHDGACAGFQVSPNDVRSGRKKRSSSSVQRIVPLSVACKAPELLTGRVSALFAPSTAPQSALGPSKQPSEASSDSQRLSRLLQALESEQKLSSFEAAVLRDVCEQQRARVLSIMAANTSVGEKKAFLLQMLTPEGSKTETKTSKKREKNDQEEDKLHAELVAKKVAAIGRRVFSPQVQMQVLALEDKMRSFWTAGGSDTRFSNTMDLLSMVEKMLDKHVLLEEHGAHLVELVLGGNQVLWSALLSYQESGTLSDLETTAKRLAALGVDPPKPISNKKNKGKSPRKLGKSSPVKKRVQSVAAAVPSAVSVVRSLRAQHMLTGLELDIIQALVTQDDTQVLQVLRDFEQSDHRDVGALRDSLVGIVEEITMELGDEEKAAAAFARGMDDAVREGSDFEDSDDDSDSLGWQKHLSFLLGQWQAQHQLTPTSASTLRKMVAQRHNLLESAYEVFSGDGDASELLDTLQRVAKLQRQIEQSQAGQNVLNGEAASEMSLEDVVREMQRRGTIQAGDAAGLLVLFQGGNEALQAANEAFQADGDVHELEETLLLVVKHARFGNDAKGEAVDEIQAVSRLLAEFGRNGRLELWQIQLLMSLLKSHDPRLLAAVDVYSDDKNGEELLDTLEILVELAAWERHRRAMVHDWIAPLARSGKLPTGGAERLAQLVKARDDRVVAALVVFLSDNNKEEFVDTLARIACLEAMKLKNVQSDSKEGHLVLALLAELEEKGAMSSEEREKVEELVCSGEPRMLAAMDVLATTDDTEDFIDTARRILDKMTEQAVGDTEERENEDAKPLEASDDATNAESESQLQKEKEDAECLEASDDATNAESESQIQKRSDEETEESREVSIEPQQSSETDEANEVEINKEQEDKGNGAKEEDVVEEKENSNVVTEDEEKEKDVEELSDEQTEEQAQPEEQK
ncbi:Dynein heavy chain-like protein [Phytophthora citrophthora]|uniref:Dynein heavy chain-like protein n=1 Tax=Phytophthora citrophthora TaxID=4793 RepID=A0AAD9LKG1_9STRA|nr:Dynein heavy chain-like protein [Phytophthora citrophthora]